MISMLSNVEMQRNHQHCSMIGIMNGLNRYFYASRILSQNFEVKDKDLFVLVRKQRNGEYSPYKSIHHFLVLLNPKQNIYSCNGEGTYYKYL